MTEEGRHLTKKDLRLIAERLEKTFGPAVPQPADEDENSEEDEDS